ncbi:MAG: peptide-methionine (R)-S-oxide reductase MsrB [Candidatus Thalassarchaeaceae archaeon]|nr:peptide-methionine (R)-S-oxide reductase MsrB [Candidatus Thalassarchaeaceae archaeon]MDG1554480.1 peptide-methionine (R)-S-oxide reductase MsrB [Candidatus Thalassarchaeaceae archaeon]
MKRAVMSFSGGMDSTGLLVHLLSNNYKIDCVSFNYGQKHAIEIDRASANISYLKEKGYEVNHRIVDLSSAMSIFNSALISENLEIPEGHYEEEQMKATVVPNRNAIFSSIIYGYALSIVSKEDIDVKIALGVHSGDHAIYPDCRPEFYESLGDSFRIGNWDSERVEFFLPYIDGDKKSILFDALKSCENLNIDFNVIFRNTITSYNPDSEGRSSGKSGSDIERILAFNEIGREDPIDYIDPWGMVLENAVMTELKYKDEYYKENLTDLQYSVTRKSSTEHPFSGKYWDEKRDGEYTCICCGHTLFTSEMKFDSGCGWPSFHTEHSGAQIEKIEDRTHGMVRTEVKCSKCNSHLGHIFNDGPIRFGGERYCINSASMNFEERE